MAQRILLKRKQISIPLSNRYEMRSWTWSIGRVGLRIHEINPRSLFHRDFFENKCKSRRTVLQSSRNNVQILSSFQRLQKSRQTIKIHHYASQLYAPPKSYPDSHFVTQRTIKEKMMLLIFILEECSSIYNCTILEGIFNYGYYPSGIVPKKELSPSNEATSPSKLQTKSFSSRCFKHHLLFPRQNHQ